MMSTKELKNNNNSKGRKIFLLLCILPFTVVSIYNLLYKLFPPEPMIETGPPNYFSNSHGYYWIWNYFETQSDGKIMSRVHLQSSVYPAKEDEYLVPLDESEFEYYSWKAKKNKIFFEGLINLHTKVIAHGKYSNVPVNNYTDLPIPIESYDGYGPETYFGEKLEEILEDGALLSIKRLSVGPEFRQRRTPRTNFIPMTTYHLQTVSSANMTKGRQVSTDNDHHDLAKLSLCSAVKIPMSVHQEFIEVGPTKVFFIPRHYKRKLSSWLIWIYLLAIEPFRLFSDNKPSASISRRCFHFANSLGHHHNNNNNNNNGDHHNYHFPETSTSIVFCH